MVGINPRTMKKIVGWIMLPVMLLSSLAFIIPGIWIFWLQMKAVIPAIAFIFSGLIFICAGAGVFYYLTIYPDVLIKREKYLRANGIEIKANLLSVENDFRLKIGNKYPWRIIARGRNPVTNETMIFYSQHIWFNPTFLVPKELTIYVNKDKPKQYHMDIDFLYKKD